MAEKEDTEKNEIIKKGDSFRSQDFEAMKAFRAPKVAEDFLHAFNNDPKFRQLLIDQPVVALKQKLPEIRNIPDKDIQAIIDRENLALAQKYNIPVNELGNNAFGFGLVRAAAKNIKSSRIFLKYILI